MRALARWGIAPFLAAPLGAWAFGLGDIELQSSLNQPFQARITLVSATPEDLQGLRIALATPETFDRYGLDRPDYLLNFQFRIAADANGRPIVQVSSRQAVEEPFVTLLVEATWPRGRSIKEYTVLLDPPVLLPVPSTPAPVQPAQTRPTESGAPGGPINRPQPAPQPAAPRPQPAPPPSTSSTTQPAPRVPAVAPEGSYGPVQRAETLWAIAERFRPDGVSMNRMMVAMYQANPQAFGGNMNVLHVGAVLRIPQGTELEQLTASVANEEVQRQTDAWQNRTVSADTGRLVLLPPSTSSVEPSARAPAPAPTPEPATPPPPAAAPANRPSDAAVAAAAAEEQRRLLALEDERLRNLQERIGGEQPPAAEAPPAAATDPGVDLEAEEEVFVEETPAPAAEAPQPVAAPTPAPAPAAAQPEAPSLVSRIVGIATSPLLLIGVGVAALLLAALWFVRRRREEPEDVTGRWEALESEVDDESVRSATERMRRQAPEESIVVEEQSRPSRRAEPDAEDHTRLRQPAARAQRAAPAAAAVPAEETMSSQTVINLDQADPVAEADFHMAYGLYDQAAELVQKALDAAPNRRDLKLKLLEVFFVWGNKDAFLSAAQNLRKEIGQRSDPDWDKVVIMGKQICPDERLFAEATAAAGHVDVDLQAGDSPLDLAFDEAAGSGVDLDFGTEDDELSLESSATRELEPPIKAVKPSKPAAKQADLGDSLDIGERTAAGLEAALFEEAQEDPASQTTPDLAADSLAITQESPTIESPRGRGEWGSATAESPTAMFAGYDSPTVESPTIESAGPDSPTVETPTVETPFRGGAEPPTVEQPGFGMADHTAEIDLDDLGLDVKDLEDLPQDLGDLPSAGDTREQPALKDDDELLSATGVTQVLRSSEDDDFEQRKTSVLSEDDATMLAPSFDDGTMTGTEVLEHRLEVDESGDTSLVKSLRKEDRDSLDLNLDDLSAALHGADTVEQPRSSSFSHDVFGGGETPLDMDIGIDVASADEPTGTEEVSPLDPQTMTEVGTKLDLARAYIDMGDPEGARSILEEVLDEGDPSQRREAQSLIDVLSA